LDDERAWEVRTRVFSKVPAAVLDSLAGIDGERAWEWRLRWAERAPKIVLRTLEGLDDDRAWRLRQEYGPHAKEALDSILGMDGERAWALRAALSEVWPSSVLQSMGPLARTSRGRRLAARLVESVPHVAVWRHMIALGIDDVEPPDVGERERTAAAT
jgi:dTMP kinase